jgi:hypothetical protein
MHISSLQYFQDLLPRYSYFNKSDVEISLLKARAGGIESIPFTTPKNGLFRRRERSFGSELSCYYLLQTLRSYPKMLLSDSLPPFIHKNCGGVGGRNAVASSMESPSPSLEEPLAICKSIMCMFYSKTSETTSFVWRTIEMELNRINIEVSVFAWLSSTLNNPIFSLCP